MKSSSNNQNSTPFRLNQNSQNTSPDSPFSKLTAENATKSVPIEIPQISLPKGGGALKGIDEKFEVNSANGTASFNIPLPLTSGRNKFSPSLSLKYNSGGGNSAYGLGWSVDYPAIQRKTDKCLPRYRDALEEDVFIFSGVEDLVPFLAEQPDESWKPVERQIGDFNVKQYRPRIESGFARIEKISHPLRGTYWKAITRDNVVTIFGRNPNSRIADPDDSERIYQWLAEFSYDDKGNWIKYQYKEENLDNVPGEIYERNRRNGIARFTNKYLKRVRYGNRRPYFEADQPYDPPTSADDENFFTIVWDFGEHDLTRPSIEEAAGQNWGYRADAFSSYKAGFEIRTNRLCRRILVFHQFDELGAAADLVRSLDLEYEPSSINNSGLAEVTYLKSVSQSGYIRKADTSYSKKTLPATEFSYQKLLWNDEIKAVSRESIVHSPVGLSDNYQWLDLYGEGVSGIFTEQAEGWYYKSNLGDIDEDGQVRFTEAQPVIPKPSFKGMSGGTLSLQDLDADGNKQIVINSRDLHGYFELTGNNKWEPFRPFPSVPNLDLKDPNTRRIDLNGDGQSELVVTEEYAFVWYRSKGKKGYEQAEWAVKTFDEERGPAVVFSDPQQTIYLADMTGDGLTDIVRIRNGEVCYWANKGYGRFSAKIAMGNTPRFDKPDSFNPKYLHLADMSGTGATDIIYLGKNKLKAYLNLSGNAWSDAHEIDPFFPVDNNSKFDVIDLLGTGTSCLVWSSALASHQSAPMRYIDLMNSRKPHVMTKYVNNLGKEISFEYKSSTYFYLKDKLDGKPWLTKLPFPVQVVSKTILEEKVTNVRFTTEYSYHHGYFDHPEREFRGFGMVEQIDTEGYKTWKKNNGGNSLESSEELFQPPVLTKTWYHTGAFLDRKRILTQFREEYWDREMERQGLTVTVTEPELPDAEVVPALTINNAFILEELSADEWCEALRACKGMVLRQEIFALDEPDAETVSEQLQKRLTPFKVATHNCRIQLLQPRKTNKYAVFTVTEGEAVTIVYERNLADARTAHTLNVKLDELGNILETASVVYPRNQTDFSLPSETRAEQSKTLITYNRNSFTNDVIALGTYRLRLNAETETFEITGLTKSASALLYQLSDFNDVLNNSFPIDYLTSPTDGIVQNRLIERVQTLYYDNDLTGALTLGNLDSRALPFESYQLAYTPGLLSDIFVGKLPAAPAALENLLGENDNDSEQSQCKFVHRAGDANWWIRSGQIQYLGSGESDAQAAQRFFSPIAYTDPFGSTTTVSYHSDYFLMIDSVEDELLNLTRIERFNFRTLSAERVRDLNDNLSSIVFDELGLVKAYALEGKDLDADGTAELETADDLTGIEEATDGELADIQAFFAAEDSDVLRLIGRNLLKNATARFIYDFDRYRVSNAAREAEPNEAAQVRLNPTVIATITREQHQAVDPLSPIQIRFEYTDGLGKVAMTKVQAEPGPAKKLVVLPDSSFSVTEINTANQIPERLRWVGNGRTVLNNKGNPVKQYEPYFSVTPHYEDVKELVETAVTPVNYYDSLGRLVRTELPDQTFFKVEFDAWKQIDFDQNDTVEDSEWHRLRINNLINAQLIAEGKDPVKENKAAEKAAAHKETPPITHFDTLGRPILSVEHNRIAGSNSFYLTRVVLDIEGNVRRIVDARGNNVMSYKYDMLGHRVYQRSMDFGERWMLNDVTGKPVRRWDSRGHIFSHTYDELQRSVQTRVQGGDGLVPLNAIYERIIYGEGLSNDRQLNLRGKPFAHYDTAGKQQFDEYDFKGNLRRITRRFAIDYKNIPNWSGGALDAPLEGADYTFSKENRFDALNRVRWSQMSDESVIEPSFNESGLLETILVTQNETPELFVKNIDYDEKGQRTRIVYGNDVFTNYTYDRKTFRLIRLETRKADNQLLQDLRYTYDPVGNITHLEDRAIPTTFFGNQIIEPAAEYTYDALYKLIESTGREHIGQINFDLQDNWNDSPFIKKYNAGDALAWRNYTQNYQYDATGNILEMKHTAGIGSWTRSYVYESSTNRLVTTQVGSQVYNYPRHLQHGFINEMPHLQVMRWNLHDGLQAVARQRRIDGGTPETTYYVYDSAGERIRKVTENAANPGVTPTMKSERLYLEGAEVYREHSGVNSGLERWTLHVMDDKRRIALIETRNEIDDGTLFRLVRYQLGNHLGSATLELGQLAQIISYEEYHPYGTTSYQASRNQTETPKRYRYTGLERDEESGLAYHSARYYLPWLGRWLSADPSGIEAGLNPFEYCYDNPITFFDENGRDPTRDQQRFRAIYNERQSADPTSAHARTLIQAFTDTQLSGATARDRLVSILTLTGGNPNAPSATFDPYAIRQIGTESNAAGTGVGDTGFRRELRDSVHYQRNAQGQDVALHRLSSDQIGHFLTATSFGFALTERDNYITQQYREAAAYRREHPYLSFIRDAIDPTTDMSVQYAFEKQQYLSAMIGHEMIADRALSGVGITSTIAAPFMASPADVQNFLSGRLDLLAVNDTQRGNSYQDLLLTWVGYRFGQNMANGVFTSRGEASRWLNMMLTDQDLSAVQSTDAFYSDARQMQTMLQQFREIQRRIHPTP